MSSTVKTAVMEEIDIHILVVPTRSWQSDLRISYSSACMEAVSAGFIRLLPSSILAEVRTTARDQLDRYTLPPHFVFLRRLGRCLTQVSVKQEKLLQIGSFLQKGASFVEIFVIDTASIGRSMNSIDGEHQRASTLTRRGQEVEQRRGYDTSKIESSHLLGEQWRGSERHTGADYDQREWLHPMAGNPGYDQIRKMDNWAHDNITAAGIKINFHVSGDSDSSLDSSSTTSSDSSLHEFDEGDMLHDSNSTAGNASNIHTLTHKDDQTPSSNRQQNSSQQAPFVHNMKLTTDKPQSAPPSTSSSTLESIGRSTLAGRDGILNNELNTRTNKNEPDTLDESDEQLQDEKEIAELLAQIQLMQEECDQLNTTKKALEEQQQQNRDNEQWRKKYHRERQKTTQLRSRLAVAKRQAAKEIPEITSGQGIAVSTNGSTSEHANLLAQCERIESEIKLLKERLHHTRHQLSIEQQARHSKLSERLQLQQELVSKKIAAGATRARH